ncbi:hypothetical protein HID58_042782, partial [Brassica napus]
RREYTNGVYATALMVAKAGSSDRPAIPGLNSPPFLPVELCREAMKRYKIQGSVSRIRFSNSESKRDLRLITNYFSIDFLQGVLSSYGENCVMTIRKSCVYSKRPNAQT